MPGYFEDVTLSAGVDMEKYWKNTGETGTTTSVQTFGASFVDFDDDGWLDLFIGADVGNSKFPLASRLRPVLKTQNTTFWLHFFYKNNSSRIKNKLRTSLRINGTR